MLHQGYRLGQVCAQALLNIVAGLAVVHVRDRFPDNPGSDAARPDSVRSDDALAEDCQMLVRVIRIRAAFGGMGGDVHMLCGFAAVWDRRWACLGLLKLRLVRMDTYMRICDCSIVPNKYHLLQA